MEMAPRVAQLMARELGKGDSWQRAQVTTYRVLARGFLPEGICQVEPGCERIPTL